MAEDKWVSLGFFVTPISEVISPYLELVTLGPPCTSEPFFLKVFLCTSETFFYQDFR